MIKKLHILIAIPATFLLTQCAEFAEEVELEVEREAQEEARQNNYKYQENLGPGQGYAKGLSDGRAGRSRNPERYSYLIAESNRKRFYRDYQAGYNVGIR